MSTPAPGTIGWIDLTVDDAEGVRDFYASVAGWKPHGLDMGGYEDFVMLAGEEGVAGVCHARGVNAGLPAQWLIYIVVADLTEAIARVEAGGGSVVFGPNEEGTTVVIRDPAGAVCALYQPRDDS